MTEWSPVVYGRTHLVDRWRRAWPVDVPFGDWAEQSMLEIIDGGRDLSRRIDGEQRDTPRFLLARGADGVLVGVACRARLVSDTMYVDKQGRRKLYCFVGWFGADPSTTDLPSLTELAGHTRDWAGEVYERFMEPVWTLHDGKLELERTMPESAPWAPLAGQDGGEPLTARRGALQYFPEREADEVWAGAVLGHAEFALATGWRTAPRPTEHLTHLCVEELDERKTILRPEPSPRPHEAGRPQPPGGRRRQPARDQGGDENLWNKVMRVVPEGISSALPFFNTGSEPWHGPPPFGGDPEKAQRRTDQVRRLSKREDKELAEARKRRDQAREDALRAQREADRLHDRAREDALRAQREADRLHDRAREDALRAQREADRLHDRARAAEQELDSLEKQLGIHDPGAGSAPESGFGRPARPSAPPPAPELPKRRAFTGDDYFDEWESNP